MVKKTCIEAIHDHVDQAGRSIGFATKDSRSWYWQFGTSVGVGFSRPPGKAGAYNPFRNEQNKKDGWC